ncbi:hypothetical protein AB0M48_34305 [Lentzea sp. NPDC051208]|uniref:hypothetical protein n=1 Tax=Lentzea sp. NPDC051208 TaxID=3154642 RepID=UPI003434B62C
MQWTPMYVCGSANLVNVNQTPPRLANRQRSGSASSPGHSRASDVGPVAPAAS